MKVITTVHKDGFDEYGHRWVEGLKNWPKAEFVMYAEGFDPDGISSKRVESLKGLEAFKAQYAHYKPLNWRFDVVRFSNKVFAAYDAFYDYKGVGVWCDADVVTHKLLPPGYVQGLLPEGHYLALFKRAGHYPETGFWVMDCSHPMHQAFLDTWVAWFETGAFKELNEWHDCTTLDATIRRFEKQGMKTHSLSGEFERDMHPMARVELAKYLDHCKGPRKAAGFSPENTFRTA